MPYPLNSPLGRFGIDTTEEGTQRCTASIPVRDVLNPITGLPTVAPLAMLVDHLGGLINHNCRGTGEWTVSSELSLELTPDAATVIAGSPDTPVVGRSQTLGRKGSGALALCELHVGDHVIATATVRSFYIKVPTDLTPWPDRPTGSLPGTSMAALMAVEIGETGGSATVLMQHADPVLNNLIGVVHGGVSSMGLELVGSAAIHGGAADAEAQAPFHTASLRVNFLRPFRGGADAHYLGKPLHVGRSSGVAEAHAVGHDGKVAILGRLTAYR